MGTTNSAAALARGAAEAVCVRIGDVDVRVAIQALGGDVRALDQNVPLDAVLDGLEGTCRAVLQKLTRMLPNEASVSVNVAFAAKAGSLLALITLAVLTEALEMSGIRASDADRDRLLRGAMDEVARYEALRRFHVPHEIAPPVHFSPLVSGLRPPAAKRTFRLSALRAVSAPARVEELAFWPVRHLAELVRTRQVSSLELTGMYLSRLQRDQARLNHVVTYLDELALTLAVQADEEIARGEYRGPLHGIPWGAKDTIAIKGYPTTWGSAAFVNRVLDYDASVVEMLREEGAIPIAKLSTGELAIGDRWFGGRTNNPWDLASGSSGSSAGPSSATAAGGVAFAIGTETVGSLLSPAARCGLTSLRPTFGRVSRHGVMTLSWTLDRVGPICRYAEDCAIVMHAIAKPDGRDMSVADVPFGWDAKRDIRTLRVGIIEESFEAVSDPIARQNALALLDTLRSLGCTAFVPLTVPALQIDLEGLGVDGVESAAFFDEAVRAGVLAESGRHRRDLARLVPAVEYLRAQQARTMLMMELAEATRDVDVYIVAAHPPAGPGWHASDPPGLLAHERHAIMANLAGYPAVNVPDGFAADGSPTSVTMFARPFGDSDLLALAKAYQDAAGVHLRRPPAFDV